MTRASSPGTSTVHDLAREALQAEVAARYYLDGLTQAEIASEIGRSVATVSRLLAQAHANQVVDVQVRYPVAIAPALQAELVRCFGLRVARVARTASREQQRLAPQVVDLAGRFVSTLLTDDAVVCLAWGRAVRGVVNAITPGQHRGLHVVQGMGSLGSRLPTIDNPLLIQILADRVGGTPHYLPAPTIVESSAVRDALAKDPHFSETLGYFRRADIALIGIGPTDPERSGLCRAGYLDAWAMERIRATGAVGDIMVEFYDIYGTLMETEVTPRVIGMRREDLRNARTVIGVAGGIAKAPAILGALRTGLIHVLVTDDLTALKVLELARAHPAPENVLSSQPQRPRAEAHGSRHADEARRSILDATLQVLARDGYQRLSIDAVAAAAAVDRQAIVSGWQTKDELVRDAFEAVARRAEPASGTCNLSTTLESLLGSLFLGAPEDEGGLVAAHRAVMAEAVGDPGLHRLYLAVQQSWRGAIVAAVKRVDPHDDDPDRLPSDLIADLLLGPVWFRLGSAHAPIDRTFLQQVVAMVAERLGPASAAV